MEDLIEKIEELSDKKGLSRKIINSEISSLLSCDKVLKKIESMYEEGKKIDSDKMNFWTLYLLGITDKEPTQQQLDECFYYIPDYPDIDIDFQDTKRDMVFEYLKETYGADCVARIGSVSRYKAKSTITDVAKELQIPVWEVEDLKGAIIERSGGDARAAFCIMDTFNELDIGKKTLEKYPQLAIAAKLEAHARHTGQHAAGTLVTAHPLSNYCSGDAHTGATQIDKHDAEVLDL